MKLEYILIIGAGVILIGIGIFYQINAQPLSKDKVIKHLENYFEKAAVPGEAFSGIQVLVYSQDKDIDWRLGSGLSSGKPNHQLEANQPFHVASIGKLFTATLVMMLSEEGKLKLSDPISMYLDKEVLEGLFIYNNIDYQKEVTLEQLLAHTSGAADYFEDPVKSGKTMPELIVSEPDTIWSPDTLLDFSRKNLSAIAAPGNAFHYSDTGYILLGLMIEEIEKKPFHEVLNDRIFAPLKMNDSYMVLRSEPKSLPKKSIADIWFQNTEISRNNSISADWSGGGIISTPEDLLSFQKALHAGELINKDSLSTLFSIQHKFQNGIYYGLGTMEIHFEDFLFLLKGMPRVVGHIGILSTHLFYDPETKTHIIMNFGSDTKMEHSFKALIEVINVLKRIKTE